MVSTIQPSCRLLEWFHLARATIKILTYQITITIVSKKIHSGWLMFKIGIESLTLVKAEPNWSSLVIEPLLVRHFQVKVDQVDGHGAALLEPEGRDWKCGSFITFDVKFVNSGKGSAQTTEKHENRKFHCSQSKLIFDVLKVFNNNEIVSPLGNWQLRIQFYYPCSKSSISWIENLNLLRKSKCQKETEKKWLFDSSHNCFLLVHRTVLPVSSNKK